MIKIPVNLNDFAEKNSSVNYLEGCPQFSENQLHAAIVELIAFETQKLNIQRCKWYSGDEQGVGGIYILLRNVVYVLEKILIFPGHRLKQDHR
jgi:hypothetical protein